MAANPPLPADEANNSPTANETSVNTLFYKVLDLPELAQKVAKNMSFQDVLLLRQLNHHADGWANAAAWPTMNLREGNTPEPDSQDRTNRLLDTGVQDWNKNSKRIRSLSACGDFMWVLFEANVDDRQSPRWNAPPRMGGYEPPRIDSMGQLMDLRWSSNMDSCQRHHPFQLPGSSAYDGVIPNLPPLYTPVSWLISTNQNLQSIYMTGFHCIGRVMARNFLRSVAGLPRLQRFCLEGGLQTYSTISYPFLQTLLRCLPASVQWLSLNVTVNTSTANTFGNNDFSSQPAPGDDDISLGPVAERTGPITCLKKLRLPVCYDTRRHRLTPDLVRTLLQECPEITTLVMPQRIITRECGTQLGQIIAELCPKVCHIKVLEKDPEYCADGEALLGAFAALSQNQLCSITWGRYSHRTRNERNTWVTIPLFPTLGRFSQTLTHLTFYRTWEMPGPTIGEVLRTCVALESFTVRDQLHRKSYVPLEVVAEGPEWVCARLQILEISIGLAADGSDTALEEDSPRWTMFETLAHRIGQLAQLNSLSVKCYPSECAVSDGNMLYPRHFFPGFLLLPNATTGQRGFLEQWKGLTNLQEVKGSFHKTAANFSAAEASWIAKHWNGLKMIEFLPLEASSDEVIPKIVKELQEKWIRVRAFPTVEVTEF